MYFYKLDSLSNPSNSILYLIKDKLNNKNILGLVILNNNLRIKSTHIIGLLQK